MTMARASTLPIYDMAHGGNLIPLLRRMRDQGESYDRITEAVRELGVDVHSSTVYRWCRSLTEDVAS